MFNTKYANGRTHRVKALGKIHRTNRQGAYLCIEIHIILLFF